MGIVLFIINIFFIALIVALFAAFILSFADRERSWRITRLVFDFIEPIVLPFRQLGAQTRFIDLSFILAIVLVTFIREVLDAASRL